MFKNLELFDGGAAELNKRIESINKSLKNLGIPQVYDARLVRGFEETEESINGFGDVIDIFTDGDLYVASGITIEDALMWCGGFEECIATIYKHNKTNIQ